MGHPVSFGRFLGRVVLALLSCAVVSGGLLVLFASLALAVDWRIPEGVEMPGPSSVFDRDGTPLARFASDVERRVVPLEQIALPLQQAVIATEDHRFYAHQGVDALSVLRAIVRNVRTGGIAEGGSTLTQQYVKNVYVGADRTVWRKVQEAVVALQLEKERSKDEILEAYLNRVYFGDGAYGAEAAALSYFDKPASQLTLSEAATLAGTLPNPSRLSPRGDPHGARRRRDVVLGEMVRYGFIDGSAAAAARAEPVVVVPRDVAIPFAPFFVEEVRRQLLDAYGPDVVYRGGLAVTTTLDVERQSALEAAVRSRLPANPAYDAGVAVVEPSSGDVVAAWSGRDFVASQVDLALRQDYGRPSGSTFKVFALVAALEQGRTLRTTYPAPATVQVTPDWSPRGSGGCASPCSLLEATVRSANTVFVQLARDLGPEAFTDMARRMGVRSTLSPDDLTQVLGTSSVTPLDMASAFGALANDGVACPARVILDVRTPDGQVLPPPDPRQPTPEELSRWGAALEEAGFALPAEDLGRCHRALAPSVARTATQALEQAVLRGTGRRAQIGRPQAGKTGTTSDSTEVWFVGYTPDASIGVFFGARDAAVPLQRIAGCRRQCFGGELPADIWHDGALAVLADVPPAAFPAPGDDERVVADRRRLGPRSVRPAPAPTRPSVVAPSMQPSASPSPSGAPSTSPSPSPDGAEVQPTEDAGEPTEEPPVTEPAVPGGLPTLVPRRDSPLRTP